MTIIDFISGCCGGGAGILLGYPFDTVKVLMQAQTGTVKYRSTFQTIVRVTREESFLRLYRGLMTPLVTVALNNSVTFGVRGLALKYGISHRLDPVAREALAGLSAGFVRALFISPTEVVKIQMQVIKPGMPKKTLDCIRKIYVQGGLKAFTIGLSPCLVREPVAFTLYFSSFEIFTRNYRDNYLVLFTAGGVSGIISWMPTYPFDVIKTRMQGDSLGSAAKFHGFLHCTKSTIETEGISMLYRGFGSCIYRAFVVNAGVLGVYTIVKRFLEDHRIRQNV